MSMDLPRLRVWAKIVNRNRCLHHVSDHQNGANDFPRGLKEKTILGESRGGLALAQLPHHCGKIASRNHQCVAKEGNESVQVLVADFSCSKCVHQFSDVAVVF